MLNEVQRLAADRYLDKLMKLEESVPISAWKLFRSAEAVANRVVDDILYHPSEDAVNHEWAVKSVTFGLVAIAFSITEAGTSIAKAIKALNQHPKP